VVVKFFAYLRDYTGCLETSMPAVPVVGELVRVLGEKYGQRLRNKLLTENGDLGPHIIIMINGRHIVHLGGLDAPLKEDDIVQIFPKVAGG